MENDSLTQVIKDPGIIALVIGTIVASFGWLLNRVFRNVNDRIEKHEQKFEALQEMISTKADSAEMDRQRKNIATLFDHMREDRQHVTSQMNSIVASLGRIETTLAVEIAKRPTREELRGR